MLRRRESFSQNSSIMKLAKSLTMAGRENWAKMPCRVDVRLMSSTVECCCPDDILNWSSPEAREFESESLPPPITAPVLFNWSRVQEASPMNCALTLPDGVIGFEEIERLKDAEITDNNVRLGLGLDQCSTPVGAGKVERMAARPGAERATAASTFCPVRPLTITSAPAS